MWPRLSPYPCSYHTCFLSVVLVVCVSEAEISVRSLRDPRTLNRSRLIHSREWEGGGCVYVLAIQPMLNTQTWHNMLQSFIINHKCNESLTTMFETVLLWHHPPTLHRCEGNLWAEQATTYTAPLLPQFSTNINLFNHNDELHCLCNIESNCQT